MGKSITNLFTPKEKIAEGKEHSLQEFWLPISDPVFAPCSSSDKIIVFKEDHRHKDLLCEIREYQMHKEKKGYDIFKRVIAR